VVIWFAHHVPVIFVPGVYSNPGIPTWASLLLFAIVITGFSFFVGALWEKHHDVWGATFAHGVWNYNNPGLAQTLAHETGAGHAHRATDPATYRIWQLLDSCGVFWA
jgi:membrane protease YdiL (CAAX protease family)